MTRYDSDDEMMDCRFGRHRCIWVALRFCIKECGDGMGCLLLDYFSGVGNV